MLANFCIEIRYPTFLYVVQNYRKKNWESRKTSVKVLKTCLSQNVSFLTAGSVMLCLGVCLILDWIHHTPCFISLISWHISSCYLGVVLIILPHGGGGEVDCAHTFFRWLFLYEKRGLEVTNFLTYPYLWKPSRK